VADEDARARTVRIGDNAQRMVGPENDRVAAVDAPRPIPMNSAATPVPMPVTPPTTDQKPVASKDEPLVLPTLPVPNAAPPVATNPRPPSALPPATGRASETPRDTRVFLCMFPPKETFLDDGQCANAAFTKPSVDDG
jgi:hypothetical protein